MRERLEARLKELQAERQRALEALQQALELQSQFQTEIVAKDGAIVELQRLLDTERLQGRADATIDVVGSQEKGMG